MYCPHCGTKLPELEWERSSELEQYTKEFPCPNPDCGTNLVFTDERPISQEGVTEITMH